MERPLRACALRLDACSEENMRKGTDKRGVLSATPSPALAQCLNAGLKPFDEPFGVVAVRPWTTFLRCANREVN